MCGADNKEDEQTELVLCGTIHSLTLPLFVTNSAVDLLSG